MNKYPHNFYYIGLQNVDLYKEINNIILLDMIFRIDLRLSYKNNLFSIKFKCLIVTGT